VLVLTLTTRAAPPFGARMLVRAAATLPTPMLAGLLARHWRVDGGRLRGRYLFDGPDAARAFAADPVVDPAVAALQSQPLPALQVEPGGREEAYSGAGRDALDRPVFVVSAPRAGSTLLAETLSLAPGLWTLDGEAHGVVEGVPPLHPAARGYASQRLDADDADPATVATLAAAYLADLRDGRGRRWLNLPAAERPARVRLLDKTPEHVLRIPFLAAAFPDARFVFLHRQARPNVSSILAGWQHGGFVNIPDLPGWRRRHWCFLLPPGWRSYDAADLSDVAAFQWRRANEQALDDLDCLPRDRWISVGHEELVAGPGPVVRRLCTFLELETGPALDARLSGELPLSSTTTSPPSPIKWRSNRALRESSFTRLGLVGGRLRNLTTTREALRAAARPERPPVLGYACHLDDLPPAQAFDEEEVVHPGLQVQIGASVPLALARRARCRERFVPDLPVLWVEDPATRVLHPFWARRGDAGLLRALMPGRPAPADLPEGLADRLRRGGVLVSPAAVVARRAEGERAAARAAAELARVRCAALPALLQPAQLATLADYYRRLVASGRWALGDAQVERRYGWHNERMAQFFQHQLAWYVSQVAREPVKPTYSYSSAYQGGAALPAHTDREQCDYTLSMLLDEADPSGWGPWPLWFLTPEGRRSVTVGPGEAVLFRGCELPHWREAAPPDRWQTMLLFHYVAATFSGVLD